VGRAAFTRFLGDGRGTVSAGGATATWDELAERGREWTAEPGSAYAVDPAAGLDSFAALFAVARVPDTTLLWASAESLGVAHRPLGPALSEVEPPVPAEDRPLWGVRTSGSSGTPKVAIGHSDLWELVALHYRAAMWDPHFPPGAEPVVATCLPLGFSAAFFMTVLPSLFFRRDLLVHPVDDWSAVVEAASRRDVVVLGVPALAAAACLGMTRPVDMSRAVVYLGGGHIGAERLDLIRGRFTGCRVFNLYGTAETGAMAVDPDPGQGGVGAGARRERHRRAGRRRTGLLPLPLAAGRGGRAQPRPRDGHRLRPHRR
jgi:acyl-coenzyme A synthetase/AMP-(fatty) acid ligase